METLRQAANREPPYSGCNLAKISMSTETVTAVAAQAQPTFTAKDGKGILITEPAMKQLGALMNQQGEAKVLRVGVRVRGLAAA